MKHLENFKDYQDEVYKTMNWCDKAHLNYAMGVTGESGEVVEIIKKYEFHGRGLDKDHLAEEIGDVLWYLTALCDYFGLRMVDIANHNIKKLRERYPNGFKKSNKA